MIINQYVYTQKKYNESNKPSLEDTCLNRHISSVVPSIECKLSELFDKDYDKDYIEIVLIYGSC